MPAFEDATMGLLRRGWTWVGSTYRRYTYSVNAGGDLQLNVPDKSLALTGIIAIGRLNSNINKNLKLQNYVRDANMFTSEYNLQIGSQQYPASKIKYLAAGDTSSATASYNLSGPASQIEAVLGNVPFNSACFFGSNANSATGSAYGVGFQAVQVGYAQGLGIDTQSASLPVLFSTNLDGTVVAAATPATLTLYTQCTATFRMDSDNNMINVRSFI